MSGQALTPLYDGNESNEELCPNCGQFYSYTEINDETGWCYNCSPSADAPIHFKLELYLRVNADHIEHYMAQGRSLWQALDLMSQHSRPVCLVCGNEIKHAKSTAIFCRRNKDCRHYSRKYVYLYSEKGWSKAAALALVMDEISS